MNNRIILLAFVLLFSFQNLFSQARYIEPVFDQVAVTHNVLYGQNATILAQPISGHAILQPLVLDFYEPSGDTVSTRPLVIVLHGGTYLPSNTNGICSGLKTDSAVVEICTRLAKMGYTAASIDYRLGWNPTLTGEPERRWTLVNALYRGIQDTRTAIRFFKKTTAEDANPFRVDTSRIVLWGESTGGQIALGAAYANDSTDWIDPMLVLAGTIPMIAPQINGNIWGTDWGVVPMDFPIPGVFTPGDTLCYPNWPGYSSDFQLCVSMAGNIPSLPWVGSGEMPSVLFHAPNDMDSPCTDGTIFVPPFLLPVMPTSGSCMLAEQLDSLGNNQVFKDANINDCVTANASSLNGGLEGFYPFIGLELGKTRPWHWVASPCPNNPNILTDGTFARQYLDTVFAYFAPRACAALALCNGQAPNPGGLCYPAVRGKVYIDLNDDGYNPDDPPFPGVVLEMQPSDRHAVSTSNGSYIISAPSGNYMLDVPNPPTYYATTNTPVSATLLTTGDTVIHIGLRATMAINDLQVTLTPTAEARPGFYNTFAVRWKNVGTTAISGTVTLTVDDDYDITSSQPVANIMGQTAIWAFNNLSPFQEGNAQISVRLSQFVSLGTILTSTVLAELTGATDLNFSDNSATVRETVIGSYDPNDKRVAPEGDVTESILNDHRNWLDYTVRFQNTGTASAINVFIVDTLSELLNVNTLEIMGASHPMRWEIGGQGTITWFFDNINLPDSVSNEPASHGFVRYRIQPKLSFPELLNNTVYNFADIYFDFNEPVRTNTTETEFVLPSSTGLPAGEGFVQISPNPAREKITITCPLAATEAELNIFDVSGKLLSFQKVPVWGQYLKAVVATGHLPKGTYFVKATGGGVVRTGKFVRE